ncbi:MAG: hypothetical protein ACUVQF_06355 [Fervidobacterium sp.]|uniref:hypothetical protein n=1 Tax=Fervidobacterium sp. TaxID=1871331 RepID=UPI00404AA4B0
MYVGAELTIAVVGLIIVPVLVILLLGVVGFEMQIGDFSLFFEGITRLLPPPEDLSKFYLGFRLHCAYQFFSLEPFRLKIGVGDFVVSYAGSEPGELSLEFIPRVGGILEIDKLRFNISLVRSGVIGGVYWKF